MLDGAKRFFKNTAIKKETTTTPAGVVTTTTEVPAGPVEGPAFSITKVLTASSVAVTAVAAGVAKWIEDGDTELAPGHVVALAIALMGFLAILASADVIGRSIATKNAATTKNEDGAAAAASTAQEAAKAATQSASELAKEEAKLRRDTENVIRFTKPLGGSIRGEDGKPVEVDVLAATGGSSPFLLVMNGEDLRWFPEADVDVHGPARK